jgi:broad specificity phosphatase PhoE
MKYVYVMRHGKTLNNVKGILIGHNDPLLTPEAVEEISARATEPALP